MKKTVSVVIMAAVFVLGERPAAAHCDTMDGPVVKAAQQALASGKIGPVLAWVQPKDEAEIKAAFEQTRAVRTLNPQAQKLADRYFFETLVRVHRAGEGAPYTGLKPAGGTPDPAIAAADQAIATGSGEALVKLLNDQMHAGLHERFMHVKALKAPADDVKAGREWVAAYVSYVHYVEGVYQLAKGSAGEHGEEGAVHSGHEHAE